MHGGFRGRRVCALLLTVSALAHGEIFAAPATEGGASAGLLGSGAVKPANARAQ